MIATLRRRGLATGIPSVYRERLLPCLDRLGHAALLRRRVERAARVVDATGGRVVVGERERGAIPLGGARGRGDQQRLRVGAAGGADIPRGQRPIGELVVRISRERRSQLGFGLAAALGGDQ